MEGDNGQRPVVNIIDMQVDTTGVTTSRAEALFRLAGRMLNSWVANVMLSLHNGYQFQAVRWVDLNSLDGPTGRRTATAENTLPKPGSVSGAPAAPNTSALVRKVAGSGRGFRAGRMYLSPLSEAQVDYFVIEQSSLAAMQTRVEAFRANIDDEAFAPDYSAKMVVVHATPAQLTGAAPGTYTDVTALTVDQKPATQRRRLRK
jgi:hypothetical protein